MARAPSIYLSLLSTGKDYAKTIQARLVERFGVEVLIWLGGSPSRSVVEGASMVLALIGHDWKPDKFVTEELSRAFKIKLPVIPVLIEGASMPTKSVLPPPIAWLADRKAIEISHARFESNLAVLFKAVEDVLESPGRSAEPARRSAPPSRSTKTETETERAASKVVHAASARFGRAEIFRQQNNFEEALFEYERVLDLEPDNAMAWIGRGEALRGLGKFEESIKHFERGISLDPNNIIGTIGYGESLRAIGKFREALQVYEGVLKLQPDNVMALNGLGEALRGLNRFDESLRYYDRVLTQDPEDTFARHGRAEALRQLGRMDEAFADYDYVRERMPDEKHAKEAAAKIDARKADGTESATLKDETAAAAGAGSQQTASVTQATVRAVFKPTFASFESDLVAFDPAALKKPLVDALGVDVYASHLAQLVAARETPLPLSIGLFGDWGAGKSYFLRLLHQHVDELTHHSSKAFCRKIVQIHFNAWHYLDTNLWANLVSEIFDQLFISLTERPDTDNQKVEKLKQQLREESALAAEARGSLRTAAKARKLALKRLQRIEAKREQQEQTVAGFIDDLRTVLAANPQLNEQLAELATAFGLAGVDRSFQELETRAIEARTLGGRVKAMGLTILTGPHRWRQIGLLALALVIPIALGVAVPRLLQLSNTEWASVVRAITQAATLIAAVSTWLAAQLKRGAKVVNKLETTYQEVRAVRDAQRQNPRTLAAQQQLDRALTKEAQARQAVQDAEARVQAIANELREMNPGRRLVRFLEDRTRTADYRQHLGLISLVRRDFEQLSRLLRESEQFKEDDQPMLDRIVLYIDDLDRCRPDRVIQVLEAVHLLLAFPLFAVVVAVDPRWLRRSLLKHYPNLIGPDPGKRQNQRKDGAERLASPQDYLEKIFQVPFHLQSMGKEGFVQLTSKLFSIKTAEVAKAAAASLETESKSRPAGEAKIPADSSLPVDPAASAADLLTPHAVSPAPPPPPARPAPERLSLESWEVTAVQQCQALFRTPRAVKRLANTYCLIRVGINPEDWDDFLGSEAQPGSHRTPLLLLAVCSAYPSIGRQWMNALKDGTAKAWIPSDDELAQITGTNRSALIHDEWDELRLGLKQMNATNFAQLDPQTTPNWVAKVERYSF